MPVALSYPGVYVEEIPSGVHTLTGVATSITAFVGYTDRGAVNIPAHIFSFADFERQFGGLSIDSMLSYSVRDFFQNGGSEAYIVRVAAGAKAASVNLLDTAALAALQVTASSEGTWGNALEIDVDYNAMNPDSLFNMTVEEYLVQNGKSVLGRSERFVNLTMNSKSPNYAVMVINNRSELIQTKRLTPSTGSATSTSGKPALVDLGNARLKNTYSVGYIINGLGPFEATVLAPKAPAGATLADALNALSSDIVAAINAQQTPGVTSKLTNGDTQIEFTAVSDASHPAEQASIQFVPTSSVDVTDILMLGLSNGGIEIDGAAAGRPAQTGTVATLDKVPTTPDGVLNFDLMSAATTTAAASVSLPIWGVNTIGPVPVPTSFDDLVTQINAAFRNGSAAKPAIAGASAQHNGNTIRIVPGPTDPNLFFNFSGALATTLKLDAGSKPVRNLARYAPGVGATALFQATSVPGNNGTPPQVGELTGSASAKTGIYTLEKVDLFNLLVIPEASAGTGMIGLLIEAVAYCQRRRAFMIIDAPESVTTFDQAQTWIAGNDFNALRSNYCAVYFPRLREPDPLKKNIVQTFPAAGALAGLYARTDAERGVWKAPAGISALLTGATGLSVTLIDGENGTLNQVGLNCLRTFPVIGSVAWGARTGRGADILADDYKYVPVRRLALYLEESLYRGTQWVVFEPNDEPLWSQIRLNLGAFMHTLFAQGAFQGASPREAYFVKCDKETTTQNDIDLGRVNIVVGFAPLKPAEFVVIQIQQIAGALQV